MHFYFHLYFQISWQEEQDSCYFFTHLAFVSFLALALSNSLQMKKDKGPVNRDTDNSFSLNKEYREKKGGG